MGWHSPQFWNRHAKGYAARPVADQDAYQHKLDVTRKYMHADSEVMEFACGTGSTALYHAPAVKHVYATDISDGMIAIAREKAAAGKVDNVDFEVATIEEMEPVTAKYDMVMGHSILHLLRDKEATMEKIYTMLKPGGVFVSSTACIADRMSFMRYIFPIGRAVGLLPPLRVFTGEELQQTIRNVGFSLEYVWRPNEKAMALFIVAKKPE